MANIASLVSDMDMSSITSVNMFWKRIILSRLEEIGASQEQILSMKSAFFGGAICVMSLLERSDDKVDTLNSITKEVNSYNESMTDQIKDLKVVSKLQRCILRADGAEQPLGVSIDEEMIAQLIQCNPDNLDWVGVPGIPFRMYYDNTKKISEYTPENASASRLLKSQVPGDCCLVPEEDFA